MTAAALYLMWCLGPACRVERRAVESALGCTMAAQMIAAATPRDGRRLELWWCNNG